MIRALRLCFVFALLAVPALAQTAATRATLYTEIDTLFADTGADPITPAQLRQSLDNITASSTNLLSDTTLTTLDGFTISSAGSIALTAGGTDENIVLTSSGVGRIVAASEIGSYPVGSTRNAFEVSGTIGLSAIGFAPTMRAVRVNGSFASPTAVTSGQNLLNIIGLGMRATTFSTVGPTLAMVATQNWTDTAQGANLSLTTVANDGTTNTTRLLLSDYGRLTHTPATITGGKLAAWGASGAFASFEGTTVTDSSSSGTVASAVARSFNAPAFAATSATTFTDAANLYIAGDVTASTNVTLTNSYGLWNVGKTRLDGAVVAASTVTASGFIGNVTGNVSGSSGSTTGNAATATALATPRAIYGNNFDGSAALTQVIASTYGGTGNGFAKFSGPTTSEKTFTLPNASATLLYAGGDAGTPSALVLTNATALPAAQVVAGALADGMTATTQSVGDNDTSLATTAFANAAAKATKLGSHASPDTTGGSITWATSAVYEVWTNTTTTYALPAASGYDGKAVIFYVTGTNAITIDPNSSEVIVRDGTAQTGGVTMTLTGAAGNYVCLVCDGTRWVTLGFKGTLAAGS